MAYSKSHRTYSIYSTVYVVHIVYIYIYYIQCTSIIYHCRMRSENRHRAQSPTSIVPVACAGACAGAGVPRSVFLEPFGEHFAPFCMHGAPFSEHWAPASRLRSPGLAKCSILDDSRAKGLPTPLGTPFSTKIVTVASRSPPGADFFRKRPTFAIPHYL